MRRYTNIAVLSPRAPMCRPFATSRMVAILAAVLLLAVLPACDTIPAATDDRLVVEAYFDAGSPLPPVRVTETVAVSRAADAAGVDGAAVTVSVSGTEYVYRRDPERADRFVPSVPDAGILVPPGSGFRVTVTADARTATAVGTVPPRLGLASLGVEIPDEPVSAVFVDTLDIGLDSLNLAIDARQGYIFPISVSVMWQSTDGAQNGDPYWIQARLLPRNPFSSSLIDFFLLPEQIFREDAAPIVRESGPPTGLRTWSGVYAVPVDRADDPLPAHLLRVAVLRSTAEFARFATSRTDPERREPVSNVSGGLGFVGGISVDSISVTVNQNHR